MEQLGADAEIGEKFFTFPTVPVGPNRAGDSYAAIVSSYRLHQLV